MFRSSEETYRRILLSDKVGTWRTDGTETQKCAGSQDKKEHIYIHEEQQLKHWRVGIQTVSLLTNETFWSRSRICFKPDYYNSSLTWSG